MEGERTACNKITLRDYVAYFSGENENIQVVLDGDDWNDFAELPMLSKMLAQYMQCKIEELGLEVNLLGNATVARVRLSTGTQSEEVRELLGRVQNAILTRIDQIESDCSDPLDKVAKIVASVIKTEAQCNRGSVIRRWSDG